MTDKQTDWSKEIRDVATKAGNFKTVGDVIPLPDKEDWNNICRIINKYRKESIQKYGKDILVECIADARKEHVSAGSKYGRLSAEYQLVNKDSNMRHIFEFPESFVNAIQQVYPVMFTNKKHFAWFCNNFKELTLSGKY